MADQSTIIVCPNCGTKNRVRASASGIPRCSVCHTLLPWIVEASMWPGTTAVLTQRRAASSLTSQEMSVPWGSLMRTAEALVWLWPMAPGQK